MTGPRMDERDRVTGMTYRELLRELERRRVRLWAIPDPENGVVLHFRPRSAVDERLEAAMRRYKPDLVDLLS